MQSVLMVFSAPDLFPCARHRTSGRPLRPVMPGPFSSRYDWRFEESRCICLCSRPWPPLSSLSVGSNPLGRHRGPRVAVSGSTVVVTAMYGDKSRSEQRANGLPSDGDLVAWRSTDGGRSWAKPVVINDVAGSAREGLHAFAV